MIQQGFTLDDHPPPFPPLGPFNPAATETETIKIELADEALIRTMNATYSADTIQNEKRLRGIIDYNGTQWVCTGSDGMHSHTNLVEVLPGAIPNMPKTVRYSYSGRVVICRGLSYTLTYRQLHIAYKPPETITDVLHISDKAGMKMLAQRMRKQPPDEQKSPYSFGLLGRHWIMWDYELSLLEARFALVEVKFHDSRFDKAPEIPAGIPFKHRWIGKAIPYNGIGTIMTIMPTLLTVTCPPTFHQVHKDWIKEFNYIPDTDDEGDDLDEPEETEQEPAAAAPAAAPAPVATQPAKKAPRKTEFVQQTFTF